MPTNLLKVLKRTEKCQKKRESNFVKIKIQVKKRCLGLDF